MKYFIFFKTNKKKKKKKKSEKQKQFVLDYIYIQADMFCNFNTEY